MWRRAATYAGGLALRRIQALYRGRQARRAYRRLKQRPKKAYSKLRKIRTGRLFQSVRKLFPSRGRKIRFVTCVTQNEPKSIAGGQFTDSLPYTANSCFDPEGGLGVNQPFGYDQLVNPNGVYQKYKVVKAQMNIKIMSTVNLSSRFNQYVCLYPSNAVLGDPATYEEACEWSRDGRAVGRIIPALPVGGSDTRVYRLSCSRTTRRMLPGSDPSQLIADYNANPTNTWSFKVRIFRTAGTNYVAGESSLVVVMGDIVQWTDCLQDVELSS